MLTSGAKLIHKTNARQAVRILFLLALPLAVCSSGSAASLQGQVTEVFDGESIAILSQTHTLKVRLIGAAAPAKDQAYAGVARQHLSDLILKKIVMVRYSAWRDGYLVGQVMLDDMDVCAQMIRDGVAWYKPHEGDLGQLEQQIYQASQDAARSERRGLWQDESPMAPWDFRTAEQAKHNPSYASLSSRPNRANTTALAGLSSEDLMGGRIRPSSLGLRPDVKQLSPNGAQGRWLRYQPTDRHFSVLAPSDGVEVSYKVLGPQGQVTDAHYVLGADRSKKTVFVVSWVKGPVGVSTDSSAVADSVKDYLREVNSVREQYGEVLVTATPGRSLSFAGYEGREYALFTGPTSGVLRVLSKQIGTEREVFLLGVVTTPGTPSSGNEFFDSFKIGKAN